MTDVDRVVHYQVLSCVWADVGNARPSLRRTLFMNSAPASSRRRYDAAILLACVALILGSLVTSFW